MVAPRDSTPPEYLRRHVGHEVKYLAFAAAMFPKLDAKPGWLSVLAQDSALVRGRALLAFQRRQFKNDKLNVSVCEFYLDRDSEMPWTRESQLWWAFISDRLAHLGVDRDGGGETAWPCG